MRDGGVCFGHCGYLLRWGWYYVYEDGFWGGDARSRRYRWDLMAVKLIHFSEGPYTLAAGLGEPNRLD